jgi:hypothetical protein
VPLGFFTKIYAGPAATWVNNSLSGILYVIFWCLLALLLAPDARPGIIALLVLIITCILELAQLWHPPALESLRGSFIGRTLLGTHFTWSDFAYYALGSGVGFLWLRRLQGMPPGVKRDTYRER